jgi:hypothetical protein
MAGMAWKIALAVGLPILWGLAVDFIFERIASRRRAAGNADGEDAPGPDDWVI